MAANIGADLCQFEVDDAIECEFPVGGTAGRLTRTARSITLYAGLFETSQRPVTVQLIAYRADGSVAATGTAEPVTTAGFTKAVSVTSAAADIARFIVRIGGDGAIGPGRLRRPHARQRLRTSRSACAGEVASRAGPSTCRHGDRLNGSAGRLVSTTACAGRHGTFAGTTLRLRAAAAPKDATRRRT